MDWTCPQALYLILPLSLGWLVLALYSQNRRQRAGRLFVDRKMSDRILPDASRWRFWSKLALREVAMVAGLVALAGPRFGEQFEQVIPRGSDLYVLIDVSRSMLAEDVVPSRLARAKADVASLLNRLEGERVGLIAFAGQAVVKCPLTVDYTSFRRSLEELDPNSAPRGGTAIGDAIRKSLEVFQSNSDRDQAILLITDGDDQQSYPLDAASVAAGKQVTIFTVGLGDAQQGARIPQKDKSGVFMEHQGEQVWSKLDGNLLQDIALKTSGVYIPAGTKSYDLGELYTKYLQGKRGDDSTSQTRVRRAERFQIFLAVAWIAWMIDLCIAPYRRAARRPEQDSITRGASSARGLTSSLEKRTTRVLAIWIALLVVLIPDKPIFADNSATNVRKGVKLYADQKFEEAHQAFAAASEQLEKEKSTKAAVALFDEACALHRKGDFDKARERYLQAGLSQERSLATSSHFNLGMLASEQARAKAGDKPENATVEQRKEIIDALKLSIASYRHCLELDPKHAPSRKNLEIVRQWIKFYSDKWDEIDRQNRRDETNLIQFLEYLVQAEATMRTASNAVPENASADLYAELKRVQDELAEEIPVLKDKIDSELRPQPDANPPSTSSKSPAPAPPSPEESKQIEQAIQLLQTWAEAAGDRMSDASSALARSDAKAAAEQQLKAEDELSRIWDAVVSFHGLLSREVQDQGSIVKSMGPEKNSEPTENSDTPKETQDIPAMPDDATTDPNSKATDENKTPQQLTEVSLDWDAVSKQQEKVLARARLLGPKAESELAQFEANEKETPSQTPQIDSTNPQANQDPNSQSVPDQVKPEDIKAGYRKAIELAPNAVEEMSQAVDSLKKRERSQSRQHALEAERILKEIQEAQPKNPKQDQQNQSDQNKQDQNDQEQDQKDQKQEKEQENKESQDKDKKSEEDKDKQKEQNEQSAKDQQQNKSPLVSKERIEEALRKVREREQDKRDRDRELRARIMGRSPVDKDW